MNDITLGVYVNSIPRYSEYRKLRDAVDAAGVSGEITWLCNGAGARIAAIVPAGAYISEDELAAVLRTVAPGRPAMPEEEAMLLVQAALELRRTGDMT